MRSSTGSVVAFGAALLTAAALLSPVAAARDDARQGDAHPAAHGLRATIRYRVTSRFCEKDIRSAPGLKVVRVRGR
ncbi:hypothetical protein [Streptomyces sp. NPDC017941]|uniref:hypothetical protein n=1 Tax=Streptomyces sp. NPDC017941 TaxID=3365018 RepID=UPI0037AD16AA